MMSWLLCPGWLYKYKAAPVNLAWFFLYKLTVRNRKMLHAAIAAGG